MEKCIDLLFFQLCILKSFADSKEVAKKKKKKVQGGPMHLSSYFLFLFTNAIHEHYGISKSTKAYKSACSSSLVIESIFF